MNWFLVFFACWIGDGQPNSASASGETPPAAAKPVVARQARAESQQRKLVKRTVGFRLHALPAETESPGKVDGLVVVLGDQTEVRYRESNLERRVIGLKRLVEQGPAAEWFATPPRLEAIAPRKEGGGIPNAALPNRFFLPNSIFQAKLSGPETADYKVSLAVARAEFRPPIKHEIGSQLGLAQQNVRVESRQTEAGWRVEITAEPIFCHPELAPLVLTQSRFSLLDGQGNTLSSTRLKESWDGRALKWTLVSSEEPAKMTPQIPAEIIVERAKWALESEKSLLR